MDHDSTTTTDEPARERKLTGPLGHLNTLRRRRDHLEVMLRGHQAVGTEPPTWQSKEREALDYALEQLEGELAQGQALVAIEVLMRRSRGLRDLLSQVTEPERGYWAAKLCDLGNAVDDLVAHAHEAMFGAPTGNLCRCRCCQRHRKNRGEADA
jgi:hypothetical protein